jgi:hypothetical protein
LQNDQQLLRQSLGAHPIAAGDALRQAEKVLALEAEFKIAHFKLLIAIKNEFTEDQVDMLQRNISEKLGQKGL